MGSNADRTPLAFARTHADSSERADARQVLAMTVYEVLKNDHAKVRELFAKIDKTTEKGAKQREKLWAQVSSEIELHAELEEQFFYPALEQADETRELTLEAHEEHHYATQILEDIEDVPFDDEVWKAKFAVFMENVEHHAKEEEKELFPKARKVLTRAQAQEIGEQIEAARKGKVVPARKATRRKAS